MNSYTYLHLVDPPRDQSAPESCGGMPDRGPSTQPPKRPPLALGAAYAALKSARQSVVPDAAPSPHMATERDRRSASRGGAKSAEYEDDSPRNLSPECSRRMRSCDAPDAIGTALDFSRVTTSTYYGVESTGSSLTTAYVGSWAHARERSREKLLWDLSVCCSEPTKSSCSSPAFLCSLPTTANVPASTDRARDSEIVPAEQRRDKQKLTESEQEKCTLPSLTSHRDRKREITDQEIVALEASLADPQSATTIRDAMRSHQRYTIGMSRWVLRFLASYGADVQALVVSRLAAHRKPIYAWDRWLKSVVPLIEKWHTESKTSRQKFAAHGSKTSSIQKDPPRRSTTVARPSAAKIADGGGEKKRIPFWPLDVPPDKGTQGDIDGHEMYIRAMAELHGQSVEEFNKALSKPAVPSRTGVPRWIEEMERKCVVEEPHKAQEQGA